MNRLDAQRRPPSRVRRLLLYVLFDETGSLVEWGPTTGDGESVDKIWRHAIGEQSITIDDAEALLKAG